jgi:hypothetical protein
MGVVFDEVVGEMRPDREERPDEQPGSAPPRHTDVDEVRSALARRRRLDARLAAH